jgi:hypothetical protein
VHVPAQDVLGGFACCRPQSLILSPTRELASQTTKTIQAMGEFMKVKAHTCVGGTSLGANMSSLLKPPAPPHDLPPLVHAAPAQLAATKRGLCP